MATSIHDACWRVSLSKPKSAMKTEIKNNISIRVRINHIVSGFSGPMAANSSGSEVKRDREVTNRSGGFWLKNSRSCDQIEDSDVKKDEKSIARICRHLTNYARLPSLPGEETQQCQPLIPSQLRSWGWCAVLKGIQSVFFLAEQGYL